MDYSKICFVIMPFGEKPIGDRMVDFDKVYDDVFVPAVCKIALPEGGALEPRRTDKDFFSGDIKYEMFQYLEYSRFAVADISGLNFNVAYELGARHRARESGTAIFRQAQFSPPFDINSIKAFPYEFDPEEKAESARSLITRVLSESLVQNRVDSPIRLALGSQFGLGEIENLLVQAENEIRRLDWTRAIDIYRQAGVKAPSNPLVQVRLGILCRDREIWGEALQAFTRATVLAPSYGEAWREKGIAENKIAHQARSPMEGNSAPGETSIRRAIECNDKDFDAFASLGGVLKRAGRFEEALQAYNESSRISGGHPYPLLNAITLRAYVTGRVGLGGSDRLALMRAQRIRIAQSQQVPPFDKPWCFFDLALIKLFLGDQEAFMTIAMQGASEADADWQIKTFIANLYLLRRAAEDLPGLEDGLAHLEAIVSQS